MHCHPLEPRRLFAAFAAIGTPGGDRVTLERSGDVGLRLVIGAKLHWLDLRKIDRVDLTLGNGNDSVRWIGPPTGAIKLNIDAGAGDDEMTGGGGADTLRGGAGRDYIDDGAGHDSVDGGAGDDLLLAGAGRDTITGNAGNDRIDVRPANTGFVDRLLGGDGDDAIGVGFGAAIADGQAGNDTLKLAGPAKASTLNGGEGRDRLLAEWATAPAMLIGGAGDDSLVGGHGNDVLYADAGHDTLRGNAGDDTLWGGDGHDVLVGGIGRDDFRGGPGDDQIRSVDTVFGERVDGGPGRDIVYADRDAGGRVRDGLSGVERII